MTVLDRTLPDLPPGWSIWVIAYYGTTNGWWQAQITRNGELVQGFGPTFRAATLDAVDRIPT